MIIRFVRDSAFTSTLIAAQEKTAMPFTPSHVEALMPDGKSYLGARVDGGVQLRPVGYDKATIRKQADGTPMELLLSLDAMPNQNAAFYAYLTSQIGKKYDWLSIVGFVVPDHFHLTNHVICSALQALALRECEWFKWRLAAPAHLVDPRDLLLMLSTRIQIPGV